MVGSCLAAFRSRLEKRRFWLGVSTLLDDDIGRFFWGFSYHFDFGVFGEIEKISATEKQSYRGLGFFSIVE